MQLWCSSLSNFRRRFRPPLLYYISNRSPSHCYSLISQFCMRFFSGAFTMIYWFCLNLALISQLRISFFCKKHQWKFDWVYFTLIFSTLSLSFFSSAAARLSERNNKWEYTRKTKIWTARKKRREEIKYKIERRERSHFSSLRSFVLCAPHIKVLIFQEEKKLVKKRE